MKQEILTPSVGHILACLLKVQKDGNRIVAVCPHMTEGNFSVTGFIVVVEVLERPEPDWSDQ